MTLLLLGLVVAALALLFWSLAQRASARRQRGEMRLEGQVLYQDVGLKSEVLVADDLQLKGKPDLLLKQGEHVIPVDKKPGRAPAQPYPSQTMQLAAYCALVEACHGVRPPHGLLRFDNGDVVVPYTQSLQAKLKTTLSEMQAARRAHEVKRSHTSVAKCRACGFKDRCPQRLG